MKKNRGLAILLGCLGAVIVGLVVAILTINLNHDSAENEPVLSEEIVQKEDTLEIKIIGAGDNVEEIIEIYQEYINTASGEEKAELLTQRIYAIQAITLDEKYGEQVIADSKAIDDILQTASSAIQVSNNAIVYGMDDVVNEYLRIAEERSGYIYEDMEGRG